MSQAWNRSGDCSIHAVRGAVVDVVVAGDDVQVALARASRRTSSSATDAVLMPPSRLSVEEGARVRAEHAHEGVVGHELKPRVAAVLLPPCGHDEAEPVPDGACCPTGGR